MTEVLVSVRIPSRLVKELKTVAKENHFLDLSEAMRSIIRKRWHRDENPMLYEIEQIKDELRILKAGDGQ